jgi:hypothetical protein
MAQGEGGGGHFDERRRAALAKKRAGRADSPEVIAAIQKPRSKPKPKRVAMPMAKPRRLADINLGGPKPSLKYRDIVNREAKSDKYYGDIVNRDVKTSFGGPLYSNVAAKGDYADTDIVNTADKEDMGNVGNLFGFLRDPSSVPLTSKLRRRT